jgi:putative ABC transport system permease protein
MIRQILAITAMNLRSLPHRMSSAWVIVVGIAVTVAITVSVLAMEAGFTKTLKGTARLDRAIVIRKDSQSELASGLSRANVLSIVDAPGVRKGTDLKSIASAEALVIVALVQKATGTDANVTLRGIGANALTLRPEMRLVEGRMFNPAVRELIVGKSARGQFKGLNVGSSVAIHNSDWTVVGIFESGGDAHESELQGDIDTVLSLYQRNHFQSVTVMLDRPEDFDRFKAALTTDPTLVVDVMRETDYYSKQSESLAKLLSGLAFFVGGIMALGATSAALNTMYSAVSARTMEIATLRAIGFSGLPVVISVLAESLLLSLLGSVIGCTLVWVFFNGNTVNTLSGNFTQLVFRLAVPPSLLISGVFLACSIGTVGGLFPAIRAARLPIADILRDG